MVDAATVLGLRVWQDLDLQGLGEAHPEERNRGGSQGLLGTCKEQRDGRERRGWSRNPGTAQQVGRLRSAGAGNDLVSHQTRRP